jgi:hypothetical protein
MGIMVHSMNGGAARVSKKSHAGDDRGIPSKNEGEAPAAGKRKPRSNRGADCAAVILWQAESLDVFL